MRSRRVSRVVAALAAALLVTSALGACLTPRVEAAVRDCCKKRCAHDVAGSLRSCCCPAEQSPGTATSLPQVKPPAAPAWSVHLAVPVAPAPALAALAPEAAAPPHCPLFLQRCTLVL
jgi:hypothetical protein